MEGVNVGEEEVRWEEFMQKTVIRVLLVEPDFSTRQILTALLRKSNYKVAAIADGLQAWDILKRRHNSIDLILTELDLPSISGYALLTLITEHDSCKNIPVIVTSSQDSISKVLNCMLKGAADFLIKPVRKNELKNLWRHVWRKLAVNGEHDPQNLATQQHIIKTTFENNSATNHYSDNVSTSNKRSKCGEKATDVQVCISSSILAGKSAKSHLRGQSKNDGSVSVSQRGDDDISSTFIASEYRSVGHTNHRCKVDSDGLGPSEEPEPCREAMDLIGSMTNPECTVAQASSHEEVSSFDSIPELTLSLKRLHDSETNEENDTHTLNHSNASAFSWYYSNKKSHASCPLSIKDDKRTADCRIELAPLPGVVTTAKGPVSAFHREVSQDPTSSSLHSDSGTHSSTVNNSSGRPEHELRNRESLERHGYNSSTPCNEFADQKLSSACASASDLTNVNTNGAYIAETSVLKKIIKDEICNNSFKNDQFRQNLSLHSAERKAALARFRLKRKERCFDKKVRYQSRKNLAEQRPRVKGQFVRQDPDDAKIR